MKKTKTGIKGFDELICGGFPKGKTILLSGTPGTGKTILALEYLYNGAAKFDEKGIYITFEEKISDLKKQALQFGWDFEQMEKDRKIKFIHLSPSDLSKNTVKEIVEIAKKSGVSRLVIDSLSTLSINAPVIFSDSMSNEEFSVRRFIYSFINSLRTLTDTTTLMICQACSENFLSSDRISEFLCDGIIHISYESLGGDYSRSLTIRKMREVKHDEDVHPMEIGEKGIIVHKLE